MKNKIIALILLFALTISLFAGCGTNSNSDKTKGRTLFIYMCGSNLESLNGAATDDIREMISGYQNSKVNIIIQTGGSESWEYKNVPSDKCCRYLVTSSGLKLLDDTVGDKNMGDKSTFYNFLKYGKKNFPAKHYGLILWDHGGGPFWGCCQDERYDNDMLELDEIYRSLKKVNIS